MKYITYEELAAEAEARWHAEPIRLQKAVEIVTNRYQIYFKNCPEGEYDVRSQAGSGWYHVDTKKKTCTCKDSQSGHICKHRLAVWLYTEQINRTMEAARQDGRNLKPIDPTAENKRFGFAT